MMKMLGETEDAKETSARFFDRAMMRILQNQCNGGDNRRERGSGGDIAMSVGSSDRPNVSESMQ